MKSTLCVLSLALFLSVSCQAQTWNLVWSDEFDSAGIKPSNWIYDLGGNGWGNGELEYYTNRSVNAVVDNGSLLIIARKENYSSNSYTSARLKTQGLRNFTYGRVEARIKLPVGQGIWPAFWMLGSNITQAGWPACGEIDIMEHISNVPLVYGTIHWDNNGHAQYGGNTSCDVRQYHMYAITWNANSIIWTVDGIAYWVANIANNINSTDEFHAPFFIIMNLAVGGQWPGYPDSTTAFPDTMFVDYVRVYQVAAEGVNDGGTMAPGSSALLENYPNPFNPATEVQYQVAAGSMVRLTVYDLFGREVADLVHERKAAGTYTAQFDASGLASGTYVCRLVAGNSIQSRRMVLLR